jgi:putative tryptophan/tyrosine transport system substrate-binding protein
MRRRTFIALLGGAAAAWPLAAGAQQPALPVIGFLSGSSLAERVSFLAAWRHGLSEAGYIENKNVAIEYRWAEGHYERLPTLAADLVKQAVAVMVACDGVSALVAKAATTTIPMVFISGYDPLEVGLVSSLNRPEGNLTGMTLVAGSIPAKQFGLLHELVPAAPKIAVLINPDNANAKRDATIVEEAARATGTQTLVARVVAESDFENVFATLVGEGAGGLIVNSDVFFTSRRDQLVALAARHALPAIYPWREYALAGGLMTYGASLSAAYQQLGLYAGRILKGAKPADLPVVQPTKFEFLINLKTAKTLGVTFPSGLLAIADEVIE